MRSWFPSCSKLTTLELEGQDTSVKTNGLMMSIKKVNTSSKVDINILTTQAIHDKAHPALNDMMPQYLRVNELSRMTGSSQVPLTKRDRILLLFKLEVIKREREGENSKQSDFMRPWNQNRVPKQESRCDQGKGRGLPFVMSIGFIDVALLELKYTVIHGSLEAVAYYSLPSRHRLTFCPLVLIRWSVFFNDQTMKEGNLITKLALDQPLRQVT